ncbi:heme ABC exporter [Salmonella enterica subsp. enterica serovar Typhi]|nr:heme ABC exporter [Salmonella enterica subsp. enterica serovar Typhi]CGQ46037.1 heme ABC exporter [Salmonella enterica subsp. enterica serovar Typhi]CGX77503.1 heme ABC exporter [Salmonella enterica subsp. enterica serovar Typhi]CIM36164.1 heme ABC exporter [Salmonella enterica subsp. enterica serovar Typhi]
MLEARDLYCERDERTLFRGLSFTVEAGEWVQVTGGNGAGKTTLLRLLTGLARPDGGEVYWQGEPLRRVRDSFHRSLLWIGHQPGIKTRLTARENLHFFHPGDGARLPEALAQAGLAGFEDVPVAQLSAGQQRRVALARLWLTRAALWVLDEPFTAIDVNGVARLTRRMAAHTAQGGMVILTTHQPLPGAADTVRRLALTGGGGRAVMWRVFCLELRVAFRHGADIAGPLWFFLMVITLFPLSVGPQPQLLARIAPGIIQVAALLASLLALERLFRDDLQDGSLEQLMLLPVPLPAVVLAKVLAHWAVTGLPLMMLSPLVALLLGMDVYGWKIMALTLLLGTPALGFLAAPGVGLTAGLRRGGVLLGILVLPLSVPVLIFATAAMDAASMHLPVDGYLAVLGALLAGSATLSPFATAAALRISTQ